MNTLIDLKDALDEVSRERPPLPNVAAIAQQRGRWSLRLRLVAVATATLVVIGGSLTVMSLLDSGPTNEPVPPLSSADPSKRLPKYLMGHKLLASVETTDPSGAELTFVVPREPIAFASFCAGPGQASDKLFINGVEWGSGTCWTPAEYQTAEAPYINELVSSETRPIVPGQTVTIRQEWSDGQSREGSLWSMGIYVKVPPEEFPFEGSAKAIQDVPTEFTGPCSTILKSNSRDRTFSCQITLNDDLKSNSWASAPGVLEITANDVALEPLYAWRYGRQSPNVATDLQIFDAKPGDTVTITAKWTPYTKDTSELGIIFYDNTNPPDSLCGSEIPSLQVAPRLCG